MYTQSEMLTASETVVWAVQFDRDNLKVLVNTLQTSTCLPADRMLWPVIYLNVETSRHPGTLQPLSTEERQTLSKTILRMPRDFTPTEDALAAMQCTVIGRIGQINLTIQQHLETLIEMTDRELQQWLTDQFLWFGLWITPEPQQDDLEALLTARTRSTNKRTNKHTQLKEVTSRETLSRQASKGLNRKQRVEASLKLLSRKEKQKKTKQLQDEVFAVCCASEIGKPLQSVTIMAYQGEDFVFTADTASVMGGENLTIEEPMKILAPKLD